MKEVTYTIDGAQYIQRPLVLGQIEQLTELLMGVRFTPDSGAAGIVIALGSNLSRAMAVVLTPVGVKMRDKNLDQVQEAMQMADPETAIRVVEDFFDCNPVASLLTRITKAAESMVKGLEKQSGISSAS